jgi:hypothetical protein
MRSLLGLSSADDVNFKLNIIRVIVRAVTERLSVDSFQSADPELAQWAWDTWQHNRFDVKQDQLHDNAINDGEAFVIVDWEKDAQFACWTPHPRYTGAQVDGDEFGCKIQYENDDINQEVLFASKRWRERLPDNQYRMRMTLYYPDRIEKYHAVLGSEMWMPFQDEDDNGVWPLPWVDLQGQPLGVPVFHFMNVDARPEARDAWGPQDGLNQLFLDTLASNRQAAFRIYVALGFVPTSDGGALGAGHGRKALDRDRVQRADAAHVAEADPLKCGALAVHGRVSGIADALGAVSLDGVCCGHCSGSELGGNLGQERLALGARQAVASELECVGVCAGLASNHAGGGGRAGRDSDELRVRVVALAALVVGVVVLDPLGVDVHLRLQVAGQHRAVHAH